MNELDSLRLELRVLKRRVAWSYATCLLLVVIVVAAMRPQQEVVRARGLIITDRAGRDRVVIGAPMDNVSTDKKLAEAIGLIVLDSLGKMNVAVGANNPLVFADGRTGKRIASAAGLTIYDPRNGGERGGIGAFADGRANVCLDYGSKAKEAACMAVAPSDQYAAVILNGTPNEPQFDRVTMYVGADGGGSIKAFGGGNNNSGVMIRAGKGTPSVTVYDSLGKAITDLAKRQ
jgi:hypothetical protein